jgi:predicted phosphodiesterase
VGYIPTPDVVNAIFDMGAEIICVRGNHEEMLIRNYFDPALEPVYQLARIRRKMDEERIDFIKGWPVRLSCEFRSGKILFVHGSPLDPLFGYLYPNTDLSLLTVNETFIFMGHTHIPFIRRHKETTYINVGSCGLPRDHGGVGSVALFDEKTGQVNILRFDILEETQRVFQNETPIHPSVHSLLLRKADTLEGEIIGD